MFRYRCSFVKHGRAEAVGLSLLEQICSPVVAPFGLRWSGGFGIFEICFAAFFS